MVLIPPLSVKRNRVYRHIHRHIHGSRHNLGQPLQGRDHLLGYVKDTPSGAGMVVQAPELVVALVPVQALVPKAAADQRRGATPGAGLLGVPAEHRHIKVGTPTAILHRRLGCFRGSADIVRVLIQAISTVLLQSCKVSTEPRIALITKSAAAETRLLNPALSSVFSILRVAGEAAPHQPL